jgi:hypothetical protein
MISGDSVCVAPGLTVFAAEAAPPITGPATGLAMAKNEVEKNEITIAVQHSEGRGDERQAPRF